MMTWPGGRPGIHLQAEFCDPVSGGQHQPATYPAASSVDGRIYAWLRDVKQTGAPPAALQQFGAKP